MGRGNTFDDIGQMSCVSEATAGKAFHIFCKCFAAELFCAWIKLPEGEDLKETTEAYEAVGWFD